MKKKLTSAELAEAWMAGEIKLRTALRRHWQNVGLWPVDEKFIFVVELVLGFANLGMMDRIISLGDGEEITVAQAIERYKLSDFLG